MSLFFLGMWDVSTWTLVAWTAISCHITLLSVTVYLHRSQAHRAVDHLLDEATRVRVAAALASSELLKTVHELQNQLQAIWHKAGASQEALLQALQDWCKQAEATGIECLQEFPCSSKRRLYI